MSSNMRNQDGAPANGGAVQGWNGSHLAPQRIERRTWLKSSHYGDEKLNQSAHRHHPSISRKGSQYSNGSSGRDGSRQRAKNGMRDFSGASSGSRGRKEASTDSKDGHNLRQKQFQQLQDHVDVEDNREEEEKALLEKLYPKEVLDTPDDARNDTMPTCPDRKASLPLSSSWMDSSGKSSRLGREMLSRMDCSSMSVQSQYENDFYLHANMSSLYMEEFEQEEGVRISVDSSCTKDHPPTFPHRMNGSSSRRSWKMNSSSKSSFFTRRHSMGTSTITSYDSKYQMFADFNSYVSFCEEIDMGGARGVFACAYVDSSGPRMPTRRASISTMNDISGSSSAYNGSLHRSQRSLSASFEDRSFGSNTSRALTWIGEGSVLSQEDNSLHSSLSISSDAFSTGGIK